MQRCLHDGPQRGELAAADRQQARERRGGCRGGTPAPRLPARNPTPGAVLCISGLCAAPAPCLMPFCGRVPAGAVAITPSGHREHLHQGGDHTWWMRSAPRGRSGMIRRGHGWAGRRRSVHACCAARGCRSPCASTSGIRSPAWPCTSVCSRISAPKLDGCCLLLPVPVKCVHPCFPNNSLCRLSNQSTGLRPQMSTSAQVICEMVARQASGLRLPHP